MKVLVACEESQAVCIAFREMGHEAYSCDILPCSGGHPEWHIEGDVMEVINDGWDMMIAHPPCTYMSKAGARWMYKNKGVVDNDRMENAIKAKEFFLKLFNCGIDKIAVENPIPLKIVGLPPATQVIQPYEFGHEYSKRTLLWLKNLPILLSTVHAGKYQPYLPSNTGGKKRGQKYSIGISKNSKQSSKTFPGIAKAMAQQWGTLVLIITLLTSCTINHYQNRAQATVDRVQWERCESYRETVWSPWNNRPGEQDSIMNLIKQNHR